MVLSVGCLVWGSRVRAFCAVVCGWGIIDGVVSCLWLIVVVVFWGCMWWCLGLFQNWDFGCVLHSLSFDSGWGLWRVKDVWFCNNCWVDDYLNLRKIWHGARSVGGGRCLCCIGNYEVDRLIFTELGWSCSKISTYDRRSFVFNRTNHGYITRRCCTWYPTSFIYNSGLTNKKKHLYG